MHSFFALILALMIALSSSTGSAHTSSDDAIDDVTYPTLTALEQTVIPFADPVDLARRLRGVDIIDPPPASPPALNVGDGQSFHVTNSIGGYTFDVPAVLWVIGDHIYLWVEEGV